MKSTNTERLVTSAPAFALRNADHRMHSVLIVDDHAVVRQGLRSIIESQGNLRVCAEAETEAEAREGIRRFSPDVMITDLTLQHGEGMELLRNVRAHHHQLAILVLSMHDESIYAERMLAAGANGYIMKDARSDEFLVALRMVLAGGVYVSKAIGARMINKIAIGGSRTITDPVDKLSTRELQILHMIGKGMGTREVAVSLNLSIKTIESHRQRLKRKLNLPTSARLVQYAVKWYLGRELHDNPNGSYDIRRGGELAA